jgi:hypothetical protein
MKRLKAIFVSLGVMVLGMMGGQGKIGGKGTRRFGIPGLAILAALSDGYSWKDLVFVLLVPVLIMGYGENSWLLSVCKVEWLVRMVYAAILSAPFVVFGLKRWLCAAVLLIGAFSIHAGSLGTVAWFGDILIEDMFRYGVLGLLISYNIFFGVKK